MEFCSLIYYILVNFLSSFISNLFIMFLLFSFVSNFLIMLLLLSFIKHLFSSCNLLLSLVSHLFGISDSLLNLCILLNYWCNWCYFGDSYLFLLSIGTSNRFLIGFNLFTDLIGLLDFLLELEFFSGHFFYFIFFWWTCFAGGCWSWGSFGFLGVFINWSLLRFFYLGYVFYFGYFNLLNFCLGSFNFFNFWIRSIRFLRFLLLLDVLRFLRFNFPFNGVLRTRLTGYCILLLGETRSISHYFHRIFNIMLISNDDLGASFQSFWGFLHSVLQLVGAPPFINGMGFWRWFRVVVFILMFLEFLHGFLCMLNSVFSLIELIFLNCSWSDFYRCCGRSKDALATKVITTTFYVFQSIIWLIHSCLRLSYNIHKLVCCGLFLINIIRSMW